MKRDEIRIRDPFVLVDNKSKKYYLYGTTCLIEGYKTERRLCVYESSDLETFSDPITVFDGTDFWAESDYWAPEVFYYNDKYYMFASFKSKNRSRCTQVLVCDTPNGKFKPLTDKPLTPDGWECLDGTLYVEDGKPYMIFCREWLDVKDGQMYLVELSPDLKTTVSEPKYLFSASENSFATPFDDGNGNPCYVTDGPFVYRDNDKTVMLWSSVHNGEYCILKAVADTINGKWTQIKKPVFSVNGGHCMLFTDLDGHEKMALHYPNQCPQERAMFLDFHKSIK
ncbi:MAG: glycoside hydrolase [Clostridiales bacterium]|nr:glycoside hydrolase [Clostridiales bacterium]